MNYSRLGLLACLLMLFGQSGWAQTTRRPETYRGLTNLQAVSGTLPGAQYMREHVVARHTGA